MGEIDIQVITTGLIGLITTVVGSWTSWIFAKRKYNAEVDNNLIENMQKSLEFYMKLSDDNKSRLDEALRRNDALEDEVRELRKQVSELMISVCADLSCELRKRVPNKKKVTKKECQENNEKD